MDIDILEEKTEGTGLRNIEEDKEMQAYASVLYLLGKLHSVVPDDYIAFTKTYIMKKFPILGKIRFIDDYLYLCNKDLQKELKDIAGFYNALSSLPGNLSSRDKFKAIEKTLLKDIKPVHEEDLLIEDIDIDVKKKEETKISYKTMDVSPIQMSDNILEDLLNNQIKEKILEITAVPKSSLAVNGNLDSVSLYQHNTGPLIEVLSSPTLMKVEM